MAMQFGSGDGGDEEPMVDINTTPLIDVLLVLLVMLIITIPIQQHSVSLEMPGLQTPPPPREPVLVRIDVTAAGQFLWDGQALDGRGSLEVRLREAAQRPDQPEIHIRPERGSRYEWVAAVLASSQRLGLQRVGLVGGEQFSRR